MSALRLLLFVTCWMHIAAAHAGDAPRFHIDVRFDLPKARLVGSATIDVPKAQELEIWRGSLTITSIAKDGAAVTALGSVPEPLKVRVERQLVLHYEATLDDAEGDFVGENNIVLGGVWYPVALGTYRFSVSARLPSAFVAVSEGEGRRTQAPDGNVRYAFDLPQLQRDWDGVSFVASREWVTRESREGDVAITVRVNRHHEHRVGPITEQTQGALRDLQALLGSYPYRSLTIVEHPLSDTTSLAMPGYVLLSQAAVQADSRGESLLRHEIAHQWFGNAVLAGYDGNWHEGLATYFGAHFDAERHGRGWALRQRYLAGYQNNVRPATAFRLSEFRNAYDRASGHIGYRKSAMVFHMLRRQVGDANFFEGIRRFLTEHRFSVASWRHIRAAFEVTSGEDLQWFFDQWLERTGAPELRVGAPTLEAVGGHHVLSFAVFQEMPAYALSLPLTVEFADGTTETRLLELHTPRRSYRVALDRLPVRAVIDGNYDVFRSLRAHEFPPLFDRLMARGNLVVVARARDAAKFETLIAALRAAGARIAWQRRQPIPTIVDSVPASHSVVFLGCEPQSLQRLMRRDRRAGFSFDVLKHPESAGEVVAIVTAASKAAVDAATPWLLSHREYSFASHEGSEWLHYGREAGSRGILTLDRLSR